MNKQVRGTKMFPMPSKKSKAKRRHPKHKSKGWD